jgi:tripartite ATP-independent transporter DctP family solute receptor
MKKGSWLLGALGLLLVAGCAGGGEGGSGAQTLRVACVLPSEHPTAQALEFFKKRLEKRSDGQIEVQLFLNGQLGGSTETIQSTKRGNIEMIVVSAAPLSQSVPEVGALMMPYLFRSKQHKRAVLDGPIGEKIAGFVEDRGLEHLTFFDAGTRNVMTKSGPVRTPADLKGKKLRVMPSELTVDAVSALGASAVPMDQGQVYSALQTGVLDGWENNAPTALTFKMHETGCTHFARTRHLAIPDLFLASPETYQSLSDTLRGHLDRAVQATQKRQRTLWTNYQQKAVRQLKEAGMTFTDVDTDAFAKQVEPVYQKYYQKRGSAFKRLCKRIQQGQPSDTTQPPGATRPSETTRPSDTTRRAADPARTAAAAARGSATAATQEPAG